MELVVASLVDLVPVFAVTLRQVASPRSPERSAKSDFGARTLGGLVALTARQRSVIEVIAAVLSEPALLECSTPASNSSSTRRPSS